MGDPIRLAIVDELTVSDRSPLELRHLVGIESNLLAHHLSVLDGVGVIEQSRSSGDGRRRYVHLRSEALGLLAAGRRVEPGPALFLCTANSARSQLAAALWQELTDRLLGTTTTRDTALYVVAQVSGGCAGAVVAKLMFELPAVELSTTVRSSPALWLSEVVATVGLLLVINGCVRTGRAAAVPFAVGAWIGGADFFTSSTSFANPAVAVARTLSDTFAGIAPSSAPMFVAMQLVGALVAVDLIRFFSPHPRSPHG